MEYGNPSNSSAPPIANPVSAETVVLDIHLPTSTNARRVTFIALLTMLGFGSLFCIVPTTMGVNTLFAYWLPIGPWLIFAELALFVSLVAIAWRMIRSLRERGAVDWLESRPGLRLEQLNAELNVQASDLFANRHNPRALARWLALRHPGKAVFRIAPVRLLGPIEPLTVPIEPLLIRATDASFAQLGAPDAPAGTHVRPNAARHLDLSWAAREIMLLAGVMTPIAVVAIRVFGLPPNSWGQTLIFTLGPLVFGVIRLVLHPLTRGEQWFIVNGAILVRRRRYGIARLTRAASGLVIHLNNTVQGALYLSDGRAVRRWPVTPREAEVVLRAWLSPLPPPDVAKLSDLQ